MTTIEKIKQIFPCRDKIITDLFNYIGDPNDYYPQALFLYGDTSTGKTNLIRKFLVNSGSKYVFIDLIECYISKILFESIINELKYVDKNNAYVKCENMQDFFCELKNLEIAFSYIICIDNAERIRDMEANILSAFIRLQELTGLNICCVLISQVPLEKYYLKTGLCEIIKVHFPQYNKDEIQKILLNDFQSVKNFVEYKFNKNKYGDLDTVTIKKFVETLDNTFYKNYLNAFLSVFYRSCRDLTELKIVSRNVFEVYCGPVLLGDINAEDVTKLWRHIAKPLKITLAGIYTRIDTPIEISIQNKCIGETTEVKSIVSALELPFYAKYLLIAAFLASHNAAKDDKRLFVKQSGRQKKRLQTVNANAKVSEKMSTSLGPKSFSIDRLLAIFYAILDEKVGLTCNLLAQISTLVQLKFLTFASGENNIMDGSAKLQCLVNLDFISHIGKVVGFNVKQYLSDFQ